MLADKKVNQNDSARALASEGSLETEMRVIRREKGGGERKDKKPC